MSQLDLRAIPSPLLCSIDASPVLLPVVVDVRQSAVDGHASELRMLVALALPRVALRDGSASELHRMDQRIVALTTRIEDVVSREVDVLVVDHDRGAQHRAPETQKIPANP